MDIIGSTQYVDLKHQQESWYQLEVINQWDFITKPICYRYSGDVLIMYCLRYSTKKDEFSTTSIIVTNITTEIKEELVKMGYIMCRDIKTKDMTKDDQG